MQICGNEALSGAQIGLDIRQRGKSLSIGHNQHYYTTTIRINQRGGGQEIRRAFAVLPPLKSALNETFQFDKQLIYI